MTLSNESPAPLGHLVLIVDDAASSRHFLATALQAHQLLLAESGEQALEQVSEQVHCVIMDAKMPGLSGFETSTAIWERYPHIPIIMHTANQQEHDISKIVNYGFYQYIIKGTPALDIQLKVKNACERYQAHLDNQARTRDLAVALEELRKAQYQLVHNERATATNRLVASLSHRLKNPMIAIETLSPHLTKDIDTLFQMLPRLLAARLDANQSATLFAIAQSAFHNALNQRAPTTLEEIKTSQHYQKQLQEKRIFFDKSLINTSIKYRLSIEQIQQLYQLSANISLTEIFQLLHLFVLIGNQLRVAKQCAGEISHEMRTILNTARQQQEGALALPSGVSVNEAIRNALDILSFRLKKIQVDLDLAELPAIQTHPIDLMYCFIYILENAIDAMGGQGLIKIQSLLDEQWIKIHLTDHSKTGIPPAHQTRIFDAFYTTKAEGQGTGLGLYDARRIVIEKLHGQIHFTSVPGQTTFTIALPVILPSAHAASAPIPAPEK